VARRPDALVAIAAAGGVLGPGGFITAWFVLGAQAHDYSPVRNAISRLAATGTATRPWMTAGIVALGVGLGLFAIVLHDQTRGPAWMLALATGVVTVGVAAVPLGSPTRDTLHGGLATLGYATLAATPLAAAAAAAIDGESRSAALPALAGVVSLLFLAGSNVDGVRGLSQRVGLSATHLWVMATAFDALRRHFPWKR
jgi:hypothetical protein